MSANKQEDPPEITFPTWPSLYRYARQWITWAKNNRAIADEITLTSADADGGGKMFSLKNPGGTATGQPVVFDTAGINGAVYSISIPNATIVAAPNTNTTATDG